MDIKIDFNCKWIEKAVHNCLNKAEGEIFLKDLEPIKYLRIGESFQNDFVIEISTSRPPSPFADTDGGDEWGYCCLRGKDIESFIRNMQGKSQFMLFFNTDTYDTEWEYAWSDEAGKAWEQFKNTVIKENYYEKIEDEEAWEQWYNETAGSFQKDLKYFANLEVLRIQGGKFLDFNPIGNLTKLRAVEIVETYFQTSEGMSALTKLQQLCCWLD